MGRIMLATSASTDEEYGGTFVEQASNVAYNNTTSGLTADDVQGAIDEIVGKDEISVTLSSKLSAVSSSVKAIKSNGITIISGYFTLSSAVSNNDVLFTLGSNDMVINNCYSSAYGPNDKRIALTMSKNSNNVIVSGNPVVATAPGEIYGFTMIVA